MPYVYAKAAEVEAKPKVGDGNCVALVQQFTKVGHTSSWRPAENVMEATHIPLGTVIATFDGQGKYPNNKKGNHAALFLGFGPTSQKTGKPTFIRVMDQWKTKKEIRSRGIYPRGKSRAEGNIFDDSDNAGTMFVVW
jgi:hypothetical protein